MILPFLQGIYRFNKAPVTWSIFLLNLIVMLVTLNQFLIGQANLEKILSDDLYMVKQGEFYAQYVYFNKNLYPDPIQQLVKKAIVNGDREKLQLLGSIAIRDQAFLDQVENFNFSGDVVALEWWKKKLAEVRSWQAVHPSYALGLDSRDISMMKWLSYQFVHSGFMHFLGNMFFLLIFGCMLESIIGGLGLLTIYLASGMMAAGIFLFMSGASSIPLIGASGAVSGLMALFCILFWKRPVRYIYFLFIPRKGYAGYVFLPGWVTFAVWFVSDLAGYLSTMGEFGGVAHTAHLGGDVAGVLVAVIIYFIRKFTKSPWLVPADTHSVAIGSTAA